MPYKDIEARRAANRRSQAKKRAENPEKFEAAHQTALARHKERHPESGRIRTAKYRATHLEECRAYDRAYAKKNQGKRKKYAQEHPKQRRATVTKWRINNPEKITACHQRRRARKANAPINDLSAAQWREIKDAFGHRCVYCGRKMQRLTPDPVTPYAHNGSNTLWNVVPACKSCNSKKGPRAPLKPVQPLLLTIAPARKPKAS